MRKLLFLSCFLFLIMLIMTNAQECIVPEQGMEINEDALLCEGSYSLEKGILLSNDNIVLDCNGASLSGNGVSYGILVKNKENIIVRNCNITNYEVAIYLENANSNNIVDNYLSKNRFGIVVFSSEDNNIENNIMEDNSRSNTIEYSPIRLFEEVREKEAETEKEVQIETEIVTPLDVFKNVVRIKNPELSDEEISFEIESIFNKYFNATQENLELKRFYIFNETTGSTKVILRLIPKKILFNLSIYENIPKCMSQFIGNIAFEQENFEVIQADPLIMWQFAVLSNEETISYNVFKNIDEDCKRFLTAFGIATGFGEEKKEYNFLNIALLVILTLVIIVGVILFKKMKENS